MYVYSIIIFILQVSIHFILQVPLDTAKCKPGESLFKVCGAGAEQYVKPSLIVSAVTSRPKEGYYGGRAEDGIPDGNHPDCLPTSSELYVPDVNPTLR